MNLYIYSNRHIRDQVTNIKKNSCIILENDLSRKRWSLYFRYNNINETELKLTYISLDNFLDGEPYIMTFDHITINPPYKNGRHIDIFNKAFDRLNVGGTIICIHPSTPFINRKSTNENDKTRQIKDIVSEYKTRLTLINGNKVFDAGYFVPLSITCVKKVKDKRIEVIYSHIDGNNKEVKVYDTLDNIFIHGDDIVLGIRDKIFSKMDLSISDKLSRNGACDNFYLKINTIAGHPPKNGETTVNSDFYCIIYKQNEYKIKKLITDYNINGDKNFISLKTKTSADNCGEYLMTYFARFCLSLYKINVQLSRGELKSVPYMDFTQNWPDEKLFKEFKINKVEEKYIREYVGKWYDRDFK